MRFFAGFGLRFLMGLLFRPPFFRLAIVLFFGRPMIQLPGGRDGASDGRVFFTGSDYFTHAVPGQTTVISVRSVQGFLKAKLKKMGVQFAPNLPL